MELLLEDLFMGQVASPSFREGFRWEESRRRVRVSLAGITVADSKEVMLLHEFGRLPVFYFPGEDIRWDLMAASELRIYSELKGEASYWTVHAGEKVAINAAWHYAKPPVDGPQVQNYLAFYWDKMDAWYEEDEQVFAHARDPYKRVDILPSSRHVRIVLSGVTIADTKRPRIVIEGGLPTRYYIPEEDVHMELLEPSSTISRCPYKGKASYWSAKIGEQVFKDIVWSYQEPLSPCSQIAGLLCFFDERVDTVYMDNEPLAVPKTRWSE